MDLRDFDTEVIKYEILSTHPGRAGNWLEPAEPEVKEIHIKCVSINLEGFDDICEIWDIQPGDCVFLKFDYSDSELTEGLSFDDMVLVASVAALETEIEIGCDIYLQYLGRTPPQSQAGRN